jgi:hypothetical protein
VFLHYILILHAEVYFNDRSTSLYIQSLWTLVFLIQMLMYDAIIQPFLHGILMQYEWLNVECLSKLMKTYAPLSISLQLEFLPFVLYMHSMFLSGAAIIV